MILFKAANVREMHHGMILHVNHEAQIESNEINFTNIGSYSVASFENEARIY
jgi:hypothetical protein